MRAHDFRRLALAHELLARAVPAGPVPVRQTLPGDPSAWTSSMRAGMAARDPAGTGLGFEASLPVPPEAALGLM